MMHDALTNLLQANLAAAAAILAVILLRKPARAAFGARIAYAMWLLVPLAAAASLAPPRPAEVLPALPPLPVAPAPLIAAAEDTVAQMWTWGAPSASPAALDPTPIVLGLWIAGLLSMVLLLAWRQRQFMLQLRHGEAGPAVVGFIRPRIVTPSDFEERFDLREQAVVLAHEKIHLVRHDARINAIVALARCVCWFNPLIHIGAHLMRVDQELACDAAVVERHPKARAPYAQALLKAQLAARPLPVGCYWPAGTQHPLTERIAMLKRSNPSPVRRLSGAVLVAVLSAAAGYAAWASAPATAPAAEAPLAYIEEVLAPSPEPIAEVAFEAPAQPQPQPQSQPAPAPQQAMPQVDPMDLDPQGRPYYGQAFARRYDGNDPVQVRGVVVRSDDLRPNAALWVYGTGASANGPTGEQLWRVDGGAPQTVDPNSFGPNSPLVGAEVTIRGYLTKDKACDPTCRINGRTVTMADGGPLMSGLTGAAPCTFEQVRTFTCPGSDKVSTIPTPPTEAEIKAALVKAGKEPGNIVGRSPFTNAIKRE